jgi:hypothetical protein
MIYKNTKYGNINDVVVVEMGTGDVHMVGSHKVNESVHLSLRSGEPLPIGNILNKKFKTMDEFSPEIVFIFNKIESLDALIDILLGCRKEMTK